MFAPVERRNFAVERIQSRKKVDGTDKVRGRERNREK